MRSRVLLKRFFVDFFKTLRRYFQFHSPCALHPLPPFKGALSDLESAVRLSGACALDQAAMERCDDEVAQEAAQLLRLAPVRRRVATQSLSQLAVLFRLEEDDARALRCFKVAAALGGAFAKSMVVALNPYAALCGDMLTEAIGRLQRGEPELA